MKTISFSQVKKQEAETGWRQFAEHAAVQPPPQQNKGGPHWSAMGPNGASPISMKSPAPWPNNGADQDRPQIIT